MKGQEIFEKIEALIQESKEATESFTKKLSTCDLATQDLLHAIEFGELEVITSFSLVAKLQEIRKERRIIKNELDVLCKIKGIVSSIDSKSENVKCQIEQCVFNMDKKSYTNKILEDII